ncbi:hypothetical protein EVAR_99223_1 [Eumeta japonica]|uniref:Uncharacterized protein n=1 Tax=Eumeta variegata TaxID=151549 RepID=A0A4C1YK21_EUMVA|nr:hypothetical protein EVAR_99223_1 [Eumeta japonica]
MTKVRPLLSAVTETLPYRLRNRRDPRLNAAPSIQDWRKEDQKNAVTDFGVENDIVVGVNMRSRSKTRRATIGPDSRTGNELANRTNIKISTCSEIDSHS